MAKTYDNVFDLVRNLSDDNEFQSQLKEELESKSLAKAIFAMRCSKGITQEEMAKRLSCSQGKISKLENSTVEDIKVSDLVAVAKALKLQMIICFHDHLTISQWIKYHVFEIKRHLNDLVKLAHKDDDINKGVRNLISETLFDFLKAVKRTTALLPQQKKIEKYPVLEVCPPTDITKEDEFDVKDELVEA